MAWYTDYDDVEGMHVRVTYGDGTVRTGLLTHSGQLATDDGWVAAALSRNWGGGYRLANCYARVESVEPLDA